MAKKTKESKANMKKFLQSVRAQMDAFGLENYEFDSLHLTPKNELFSDCDIVCGPNEIKVKQLQPGGTWTCYCKSH